MKTWKKLAAPLCIALVLTICIVWIVLQNTNRSRGSTAEVRVAEETVMKLPLDKDCRREITGYGGIRLTIVVENGSVYVEASECPDKICVRKGRINDIGDTIVCMPARTVVQVVGEGQQ